MSTKKLREALEELLFLGGDSKRTCATYDAAIEELRRIEQAAKHYVSFEEMTGAPDDLMESIARDAP